MSSAGSSASPTAGVAGVGPEADVPSGPLPSLSSLLPDPSPTDALDATRLTLPPPPASARGDPAAWRQAVRSAAAQLSHQRARLLALEVAGSRGTDAWRARAEGLEACVAGLQKELVEADKELENAHRDRRLEQEAAGARLANLEREAKKLWIENARIEAAAQALEATAKRKNGQRETA